MATIAWIEAAGDDWTEVTNWHGAVTPLRAASSAPVSVNGVAFVGPRGGSLPQDLLVAGSGSETAFGATAGGPEILEDLSGTDLISAGSGDNSLVTGSGVDIFLFSNGAAMDAEETWDFTGDGDDAASPEYRGEQVQSSMALEFDSTSIVLTDNTRVTFGGLAPVSAGDYR
jgi:hypothetical protein